jgi:hypothetical protein
MAAPGKVTLIDVRTPEEHALVGHPEMAWNVPFAFVTYRRKDGKTEYGPNRMAELKDKKIGLSKNLNTIKNDWWRIQEQQGIQLMLRLNGMTRADVERVEFPYPDDWYDNPEMMGPLMENPS